MSDKHLIDFRSDTVTRPTPEMRQAMATAEVGDDGYGEDPTVNTLEALAASLVGKEAAVYLPSGSMANEIAVMAWTERGNEIIGEKNCHIIVNESPSPAILAQVLPVALEGHHGAMDPTDVKRAIRPRRPRATRTGLVCLENTHNASGGCALPLENIRAVCDVAHEAGVPVHMDGARVFNAAVSLGVDAKKITTYPDSVMFCLSKGLCAPVGSVLAGSREFIQHARWCRKVVGGGMRQSGIVAAAGLVALETMVPRLEEDHRRARRLAQALAELPGISLDLFTVQTNIIRFGVSGKFKAESLRDRMAEKGVLFGIEGDGIRLVTHYYTDDTDIEDALSAFRSVLAGV